MNQPCNWCRINKKGEIEFLDWDIAQGLADECFAKQRTETYYVAAAMAIAVREYVLHMDIPKLNPIDSE